MLFCCPRSQLLQCSFHACERQLSQSKLNLWGALANSPTPSFSPTSSSYRHPFTLADRNRSLLVPQIHPPTHKHEALLLTHHSHTHEFQMHWNNSLIQVLTLQRCKNYFLIWKEQRKDGWRKVVLVYIGVILLHLMRLKDVCVFYRPHTASCIYSVMWLVLDHHVTW